LRRFLFQWLWEREILPDPHGIVGLALVAGVLFSHVTLVPRESCLWSDNAFLELVGHFWFLCGPPLSLFLGLRHLRRHGDSPLPLLSVPIAFLLTLLTGVGVTAALLA